jgi:hypothetical protein
MNTWIEPPPQKRGMGCLGKGCLLVAGLALLLTAAFIIGSYVGVRYVVTSSKPRELPAVTPAPEVQQESRARWDQFEQATRAQEPAHVEYTADQLNQLIAANRKARGRGFVTIENNVAHVQVSIPLEKVGFRGRYLNGDFEVRAAPNRDPRGLRVTNISLSGVDMPAQVLNTLIGGRSLGSYIDQYSSEYRVTGFAIEDNKVILETNNAGR